MLDTFILLVQANYLDYIDLFEAGRAKALQPSALLYSAGGLQLDHSSERADDREL